LPLGGKPAAEIGRYCRYWTLAGVDGSAAMVKTHSVAARIRRARLIQLGVLFIYIDGVFLAGRGIFQTNRAADLSGTVFA
jgi:hypothetical protein